MKNFSLKYKDRVFKASENQGRVTAEGIEYQLDPGVTITMKATEYEKYDAVEWVLWFENKSEANSGIFTDINDCDTVLPLHIPEPPRPGFMPKHGNVCIIAQKGMVDGQNYHESDRVSSTEFNLLYEYLDKRGDRSKSFCNEGTRSSEGMMPFFEVAAGGKGYIVAIGWSGSWKTSFTAQEDGVHFTSGLQKTKFYLKPGEKIRTSSILIMKYDDEAEKNNKFRRLIKNHFSHKACTGSDRDGIMAFELWGGLYAEEMMKRIKELKKYDIKFDEIWIDAGWYGNCTNCDEAFSGDWGYHTGDWYCNPNRHPEELRDVAECTRDAGMNMMLWFEPERAVTGTKIIEAHPEWFIELEGNPFQILRYDNEEAVQFVCDTLCHYIEDLKMTCYRQDFNVQLTPYFDKLGEGNRIGISEIKHLMGMYRIWDFILEKYPHIVIDNCSSGGRRIDIETLKRSIPFFRSDYQCNFNENPTVLQVHNCGASAYLPYNGCTSKTKGDTYAIRSSFSSSWGGAFYNAIFQTMDEEDFVWAKKITDEYRRIRKYYNCDFYNHGSSVFDESAWAIWQYNNPEEGTGVVLAFRRDESPFENVKISLKGMTDGTYVFENLNNGETFEGDKNLEITLTEKHSSVIFEYKLK